MCIAIPGLAGADDVVFSAAQVRESQGDYFATTTAHLYKIGADGSGLRQLTFGDSNDTDPELMPDGHRIQFFRRDKDDLIGRTWLCSITLDGSNLKVVRRYEKADIGDSEPTPDGSKKDDIELPGICIAAVPDGPYVYGYWGQDTSLMGMANDKGREIRRVRLHRIVNGKKHYCSVFGSEQWAFNPDGSKAFWIGPGQANILMQQVARTDSGGEPAIYCFRAKTGQVRYEITDEFLQDVDSSRSHFLTTSWQWGAGKDRDGEIPLARLSIWDQQSVKRKTLGFALAFCRGACFCPAHAGGHK